MPDYTEDGEKPGKKNGTADEKPVDLIVSIKEVTEALCVPESFKRVNYRDLHDVPMPSVSVLAEVIEVLRAILFPGYFGNSELNQDNMAYYTGAAVDRVVSLLSDQLKRGFCVACFRDTGRFCLDCQSRSRDVIARFISGLPDIREMLAADIDAAYNGDPASKDKNEVIFCYPSIKALTSYRIAHRLYKSGVPLIPRIITEMAHSETGIDIHPGAAIGESFFIDHGTGTVIGETTIIGKNVRIYQGVTLGARSFPLDKDGNPIKGIERHPVVEDDVIIYAGATILGRVTIGKGSVIGGNVWITGDVVPGSRILQSLPRRLLFENGAGI